VAKHQTHNIMSLDSLLNNAIVYDIETYSMDEYGREIDIQTDNERYIELAQVRWVGIYSFRDNKEYYLEVSKDRQKIQELLRTAYVLIGFNSEDFDYPILVNNGLIESSQKVNHVDCMKILGSNTMIDKKGFKYKGRGELMNYKFKRNTLQCMAETMKLPFQKSTIDYKIFYKDTYTDEEKKEIITYLRNDIMATKSLFDKLWTYWMPFTELIDWKEVQNLSWIKNSIASLTYKSACFALGTEPTYSDKKSKSEEMGGRVLLPNYEEARQVWYVDFASLYPHIMCMFNLFAEVEEGKGWNGNELFKTRGYYDITYKHALCKEVEKRLKERIELKKKYGKDYPMVYALKIFCNSLYGASRSSIFEKIHTKNIGWDTCWLGQQIHEFTQKELENYGFEAIYGDTDSVMLIAKEEKHLDRDYLSICLKKIVKKIFENVPFPVETFKIDIEDYIHYMMFPFTEQPMVDEKTGKNIKKGNRLVKEWKGNKKNYLYITDGKDGLDIKITGLPIKKDGATELGMKIYEEVLKEKILENKRAKFSKEFIEETVESYLKKKEIMQLISREFKVKPYDTYKVTKDKKEPTGIHAQISKGYFSYGEGVINLIKNNKIGKAGKVAKYCTVDEAIEAGLRVKDLDLEKLWNELNPFIELDKTP